MEFCFIKIIFAVCNWVLFVFIKYTHSGKPAPHSIRPKDEEENGEGEEGEEGGSPSLDGKGLGIK